MSVFPRRLIAMGWLTGQIYRVHAGMASSSDLLLYEKNMLDEGSHARFVSHLKSGG